LTGLTEIRGCQKRSKKNLQFSDFTFQLPALLVEKPQKSCLN